MKRYVGLSTNRMLFRLGRNKLRTLMVLSALAGIVSCSKSEHEEPVSSNESPMTEETAPAELPGPAFERLENLSNHRFRPDLQAEMAKVDPGADQWDSEVWSSRALAQLRSLGKLLENPAGWTVDGLASVFHSESRLTDLRAPNREQVVATGGLVVFKGAGLPLVNADHAGLVGVNKALLGMWSEVADGSQRSTAFKVVNTSLKDDGLVTRVFAQLNAEADGRRWQRNGVWNIRWVIEGESVLAHTIVLTDYREGETSSPWFSDVTADVFRDDQVFARQIVPGLDFWRERIDWRYTLEITGPHGLAVGDVNNDGRDDLFHCETGGLPNRLFVQDATGRLRDVSSKAGVDYLEPTYSALLIDLDNDGDQDLVFTSGRYLLLFENQLESDVVQDGLRIPRFVRRHLHQSESVARSLSAADHDGDGDLDLYVCGYFASSGDNTGLGRPVPYHDANNGAPNYLLENDGRWGFRDATRESGLDQNNMRFSYAAAWEDYDLDGDPDLYVANDFGRNNLYRNDGGRFTDVAAPAGVEDISAGMSVSWGDYNGDGLPDIYVGNMFSAAGNRIAYQRRYQSGTDPQTRQDLRRHARGNSLFLNNGDGTFSDVSVTSGTTMGRWSWGSNFMDFNNDGMADIMVANGMVTSAGDTDDL